MSRSRVDAALAVLFTVAMLLGGGAALYFAVTISVHRDPAAVRPLTRSLLVEENLTFPDLGLAIAAASNVSFARGMASLGLRVAEAFTRPPGEAAQ